MTNTIQEYGLFGKGEETSFIDTLQTKVSIMYSKFQYGGITLLDHATIFPGHRFKLGVFSMKNTCMKEQCESFPCNPILFLPLFSFINELCE